MPDKTFTPTNLNNTSAAKESAPSLGENLAVARAKRNLTTADIANELHLTVTMIEKLEENDFKTQAPIFMRGYLRSYAKLVGINQDEVTKTMNEVEGKNTSAAKNNTTKKSQSNPRKHIVKIAFYLAIVVMLALLGSTWHKSTAPDPMIDQAQGNQNEDQEKPKSAPLADETAIQDNDTNLQNNK